MLYDRLITNSKNCPNNIAVKDSSGCYTYSELNNLSNQIANAICSLGISEKDIIPLYSSRTIKAVAAIFGILKHRAVYLPLDKQAPFNYILKIIKECDCKCIITDSLILIQQLSNKFPGKYSFLLLSTESPQIHKHFISWNDLIKHPVKYYCQSDKDDLPAYIFFTSGSTGYAKGIVHTHNSGQAFVNWSQDFFNLTPYDKIAGLSKWNFDLSTFEIFSTINAGATLILFSDGIVNFIEASIQSIIQNEITIIYGVPTFFSKWIEARNRYLLPGHLRTIMFAGEIFQRAILHILFKELPGVNFYNLYGPTETNVCTAHIVTESDFNACEYHFIPIGKPCSYSNILLMNENLEIISSNFNMGEIFVTGNSLMQGYFSKTNSNVFVKIDNETYYRTGDFAFKNQNSDLVFVGRNDRLIKKNGFRIELSEVEYTIKEYEKIKEVAAVYIKDRIHVFIDLFDKSNSDLHLNNLIYFCKLNLPIYMVPDNFHISTVPKTLNGKINYSELSKRIELSDHTKI